MWITILILIQEFLTEFLLLRYKKNFAGSAALAETCGHRVLLVHSFIHPIIADY